MSKEVPVRLRLNLQDASNLDHIADFECATRSAVIRKAIREWIKHYERMMIMEVPHPLLTDAPAPEGNGVITQENLEIAKAHGWPIPPMRAQRKSSPMRASKD